MSKRIVNRNDSVQVVEDFLVHKERVKKVTASTLRTYRHTMGKLVEWLDGRPLVSVSWEDLDDFCHRQVRAGDGSGGLKEPAANTARREVATVRSLWKYLVLVRDDVAVSKSSRQVMDMRADGISVAKPKPVPDELWLPFWSSDLPPDDRMWLGLGYFCGFRRMEIVMIRPEEVDPVRGVFDFERKGSEDSPHKRHTFRYRELIEEDLKPYVPWVGPFDEWMDLVAWAAKRRRGEVFLSPYTEGEQVTVRRSVKRWVPLEKDFTTLNRRLRQLQRAAGLPSNAFTLHQLRHSAATNLYMAGTELLRIKELMNHSKIDMTARYADVARDRSEIRRRNEALRRERQAE